MSTTTELKRVWEPLTIGPHTVKNRIMLSAQTILYGQDHVLSDRHIAYYRERARGGTALLVTEQQAGHRLSKGSFYAGCTAWEPRVIPQYAKLADAVHEFGARQVVQLFAAGVHNKGTMVFDNWHALWGVSRVPSILHREVPQQMDKAQIADVVRGHGESARNVLVAGLDGVEVHAAHSYLGGQFLSRAYNARTDEYGGSIENRCRFVKEIGAEIRERVGDEMIVGVRLSFDELIGPAGIEPDEAAEQVEILCSSGLFDYFSISAGGYHSMHFLCAPMNVEEAPFVPFGVRAKQIIGDRARVFIVGRILDLAVAERVLADGGGDMIAMTRAQLADPHLVRKTREGRTRAIKRCVGANVCAARAVDQREVTCVMNPGAGREATWVPGSLRSAGTDATRVVVVGGGPAGMHTAALVAERGHTVTLVERGDRLGGHLDLLRRLPTRAGWGDAIDNLTRPLEDSDVEVRLGEEVEASAVAAFGADVVVCASGSRWERTGLSPYRPDRHAIPGADAERVLDVATAAWRALADPTSLGTSVLIVEESAAYLPLGLAELLADHGVSVEVISPHMFVGEDLLKSADLFHVAPRLVANGVTLTAQHFVERIDETGVVIYGIWGGQPTVREVDTVVLSQFRRPNDELYLELAGTLGDDAVRRVGDAVAPRRLEAVMYDAETLGRTL